MAGQGVLWQLVSGFDPLGAYNRGQQQFTQQQNILQQLAGQEQDRQFRRETDARDFQFKKEDTAVQRALQERQMQLQAANAAASNARSDRAYQLQLRQFERGEIPAGFERDPQNPNALRPRPGGPQDPAYISAATNAKPNKIPFGVQNAEAEDLSAVQGLNTINSELGHFGSLIADGKLKLGPLYNFNARGRNLLGTSDENSRNFASFSATLERLRNESLRLNKGVQTEGDSQRAWNELVANINDPEVVRQRLAEIQRLNQRAADFKKNIIAQRRDDNRLQPLNFDRVLTPQGNSAQANPLDDARRAIAAGANAEAVRQRLIDNGINPQGL